MSSAWVAGMDMSAAVICCSRSRLLLSRVQQPVRRAATDFRRAAGGFDPFGDLPHGALGRAAVAGPLDLVALADPSLMRAGVTPARHGYSACRRPCRTGPRGRTTCGWSGRQARLAD